MAPLGEIRGCADHDHDLIHKLSRHLDALWRYDRRTANAEGHHIWQGSWRDLKRQDEEDVKRRKQSIGEEIQEGRF